MSEASALPASFFPRMTLQTLGRGDGLLGMRPNGVMGPRGGSVTVAMIDWLYTAADGRLHAIAEHALPDTTASPDASALSDTAALVDANALPAAEIRRDLEAEAAALERVRDVGLLSLPAASLQWRSGAAPTADAAFWTLPQEDFFDDFWADTLPLLQAEGWRVVVLPGFTHASVGVDAWYLRIGNAGDPASSASAGDHTAPGQSSSTHARSRKRGAAATRLKQTSADSSWLLTLGVEVDGEQRDLVPMLAHLLQRDGRWRNAESLAAIDDDEPIRLRAPGGKRIDAPAAPLKAIVAGMLDLLTDPRHGAGPLPLTAWDTPRLDRLCAALEASQPTRAGAHGAWQLQGTAGLRALSQRLLDAGTPAAVDAPEDFGIALRPYQLQGLAWLQYLRQHRLGGILADDMGLGKTAQVLAHILLEKQSGRLDLPALVVLPTSLVFNWQAEARRMTPQLRVLSLQGAERARDFSHMGEHDMVLTTYALLWRDLPALRAQAFHLLILDEAQSVKNAGSRGAGAVRQLQARHRLCMTGTPLENHLGELWTQFDFLMPGFLGDARSFTRLWRRPIEVDGETVRAQLLAQRVRPFVLRRRKDEVASELPPRIEAIKRVRLQERQRALYESVRLAADLQVRRVLERKGFTGGRIAILDALLKLRQVCCDPYLLKDLDLAPGMERAKLALLCTLLPGLVAEGRRILIFSQFSTLLELVAAALDDLQLAWLSLTGATPVAARGALVAQFQAGATPILLISLKAGGVGLNLTAADTVIHLDPWWNPAVQEQATARAHRIGQTRTVLVYTLVVEGSIEERILELQARKAALADKVLGSDAGSASKFTQQELHDLLAPLS